jgi:hypothetical protein
MNESLTQMVKGSAPTEDQVVFSESDLDLPDTETAEEVIEEVASDSIGITSLSKWFEQNCTRFANINQVKVAIRGINPEKTLIMAVVDQAGEVDSEGNAKRNLRVFENADTHPVLNIPAAVMDVYNNGFRIIHEFKDGIFIKCYGVRTGLICVFCNNIDGKLIPYATTKVKKKDVDVLVETSDPALTSTKLLENADLETLQLLYKQSAKAVDEFTTNQDVVNWLLERQNEVTDINHHLQIDGVLIDMLST